MTFIVFFIIFSTSFVPLAALAIGVPSNGCDCRTDRINDRGKQQLLTLKLVAISSILAAGVAGVLIPILGRRVSILRPESNPFFVVKAFAAGVILATAMIHILPDAFDRLTSPCLRGGGAAAWRRFPFAGFVAMAAAMGTMMVDTAATSYYKRAYFSKPRPVEEGQEEEISGFHVHGAPPEVPPSHGGAGDVGPSERIRHKIVSQVLELGIVVHSVIIGISLGASESVSTIRPLIGALSFHQFFEGIGLGGCIIQASFKPKATVIMAVFFSLTTPIGIASGIVIASSYDATSSKALAVEGVFNAASAGILIYMALVDLLAADFMHSKVQSNGWLQVGVHIALLLGSGFMSLIATWA